MTIDLPTLTRAAPSALEWGLRAATGVARSPLTGSVQTVEWAGAARWYCTCTWANLLPADTGRLAGALMSLKGMSGRVRIPAYPRPNPTGTASGSPSLASAVAVGATSLPLTGLAVGATLLAGDYLQLGTGLHLVTADATADGAGAATVSVIPAVRSTQIAGAAIVLDNPVAVMMLTSDDVTVPYAPGGPIAQCVASFEEAFA